jgi:hypothetical protein
MSWKAKHKLMDWLGKKGIVGSPTAAPNPGVYVGSNRKQRRTQTAIRLKTASAPNRAKYEKRGAPGRASKGRSRGR